jgi:integral membrane sensor domain MASE1
MQMMTIGNIAVGILLLTAVIVASIGLFNSKQKNNRKKLLWISFFILIVASLTSAFFVSISQ